MRNLKEYPVNADETLEVLGKFQSDVEEELRVGDMRPLILAQIRDYLETNLDDFRDFLYSTQSGKYR